MKTLLKHHIYIGINKVLLFVLVLAILGVGAYAIHLTHIHATVIVSFGDDTLVDSTKLAADLSDHDRMAQFNDIKKVKK